MLIPMVLQFSFLSFSYHLWRDTEQVEDGCSYHPPPLRFLSYITEQNLDKDNREGSQATWKGLQECLRPAATAQVHIFSTAGYMSEVACKTSASATT